MKEIKITVAGRTIKTSLNGNESTNQASFVAQKGCDAWVGAEKLNIRTTANTVYLPIGKVNKGETVKVVGAEEKGWVKVNYGKGLKETGYISAQYLTDKNVSNNTNKKMLYVTAEHANMHKMASPSSRVLGTIQAGYAVELANTTRQINYGGYTWLQCKAIVSPNGEKTIKEFYIAKECLSSKLAAC